MHDAKELEWGLHDNIQGEVLWGARAIINFKAEHLKTTSKSHYVIETLWDRQSFAGDTEDAIKVFQRILNGTEKKPGALKKFIKAAYNCKLLFSNNTTGQVIIDGVEFNYHVDRWESGYCYITARPVS